MQSAHSDHPVMAAWHDILASGNLDGLSELLDDDVVFHSPVLHRPQAGKELTLMYLTAAFHVLGAGGFHYVREVVSDHDAVLEFMAEVDGLQVNGVDMIHWNASGKICDFKVMVRPWKALEILRDKMAAMLEALN